jgi:hypothetical protein
MQRLTPETCKPILKQMTAADDLWRAVIQIPIEADGVLDCAATGPGASTDCSKT